MERALLPAAFDFDFFRLLDKIPVKVKSDGQECPSHVRVKTSGQQCPLHTIGFPGQSELSALFVFKNRRDKEET